MATSDSIAVLIGGVRRRWLVQRALRRGGRNLVVACGLLLLGTALADVFRAGLTLRITAAGLAAGVVAFGAAAVWARRPTDLRVARLIDRRAALKDAIGSAVAFAALDDPPVLAHGDAGGTEFSREPSPKAVSPADVARPPSAAVLWPPRATAPHPLRRVFAGLSLAQAGAAAAAVDPRRIVPYRLPRRSLATAALLLAGAAAWLSIAPAERWRIARAGGRVTVSRQALRAAETGVSLLLADAEDEEQPAIAAAARDLHDLMARLRSGGLALDEALAELGDIESRLAQSGDAASLNRIAEALRRAGQALRGAGLTDGVGRSLQHGKTPEATEALNRLADAVQRAGRAGNRTADLPESARRLQAGADASRRAAPDLARDLERAATDLDAGRHDPAAEHLRRAGRDLDALGRRMGQLKTLKRAAGEIARLKDAIRGGVPPKGDRRWAILMDEVPESLRRTVLPTMEQGGLGRGPSGVGTGDTGSGADGRPTRLDGRRTPTHVPGRAGPDGAAVARIVRGAGAGGTSETGYSAVFAQYADQVEAALAGEAVPLGYRYYVRRYFEDIRPK